MHKWLTALVFFTLISILSVPSAAGAVQPYESYNYSYWSEPVPAPAGYLPSKVHKGQDFGIGAMSTPQDLFVDDSGTIYVADTGNNRIIVWNSDWTLARVIKSFDRAGTADTFSHPSGVYATGEGILYIADTDHQRIVILNQQDQFVGLIEAPKSEVLSKNFTFYPLKVVVDEAKRTYVVARGVFDGIMEFDIEGRFRGFIGTNRVTFNVVDALWKRLSTQVQRDKMELFIPIEFNNVDIDAKGFLYATTGELNSIMPIKRLNPSGIDVLRRSVYDTPRGDVNYVSYGTIKGSSMMVDVAIGKYGVYTSLDTKRGRLFTYDNDGNLLFVFGKLGDQVGTFRNPISLAAYNDEIIVLDQGMNRLTVFSPTRYGRQVLEAVYAHYRGDDEISDAAWREALKYNTNLDIAYIGLGKSLLMKGSYKEAADNFKLGSDRASYSKAYALYRKGVLRAYFGPAVLSLALLAVAAVVINRWRKKQRTTFHSMNNVFKPIKQVFYVLLHPFKGYWELKSEKQGSVWIALTLLFLLTLTANIKSQFSGFVVNNLNPQKINSIDEIIYVVFPFLLWCGANWLVTTLLDGEGKFSEIVIASGYALIPIIITSVPLTIISRFITVQEASFYYFFDTLSYVCFAWLLFIGVMTVHQYTVKKTIMTSLLTLIVMGIIIFLFLLSFNLVQQVAVFISTVYQELILRW
ncbi:DNA-binding beta-propeller fold protein YncE [Paenibacillus baekrokdamisoli]|nr:YIP1 family protein [Paenibacillus baekrokdamisoli]MBB3069466.1 DNA-binding beta-propeller fold protein YncE [Paenibacillus baekrokdamisoli]